MKHPMPNLSTKNSNKNAQGQNEEYLLSRRMYVYYKTQVLTKLRIRPIVIKSIRRSLL